MNSLRTVSAHTNTRTYAHTHTHMRTLSVHFGPPPDFWAWVVPAVQKAVQGQMLECAVYKRSHVAGMGGKEGKGGGSVQPRVQR